MKLDFYNFPGCSQKMLANCKPFYARDQEGIPVIYYKKEFSNSTLENLNVFLVQTDIKSLYIAIMKREDTGKETAVVIFDGFISNEISQSIFDIVKNEFVEKRGLEIIYRDINNKISKIIIQLLEPQGLKPIYTKNTIQKGMEHGGGDERMKLVGWNAINEAVRKIYGDAKPVENFAPIIKYKFGGKEPLDQINIYETDDYYHYITYGLSELEEQEPKEDGYSKYGFELTLKVKKTNLNSFEELKWLCVGLQELASYIYNTGKIFTPNEYIYYGDNIGIDVNRRSDKVAFVTVIDNDFGTISTSNGKVEFIQLVGITFEQVNKILSKDKTATDIVEEIKNINPKFITDLNIKVKEDINKPIEENMLELNTKHNMISDSLEDISELIKTADNYYYAQNGVAQEYSKAFEYYKLSAERGDKYAQTRIGYMYGTGNGVELNSDEAFKWYKLSADQGYMYGQYNVGWAYENGKGVNKNIDEAIKWYRLAAEQGNEDAKKALERLNCRPKEENQTSKDKEKMMEKMTREQALELAKDNGMYVPKAFRDDKEIMIEAIKTNINVFEELDENLYDDKDIALIAVNKKGFCLWKLSDTLVDDKDIVMLAVKNDGKALRFASERLKDDKDVVICAIASDPSSLTYASANLKKDNDILQLKDKIKKEKLKNKKHYKDSVFGNIEISEDGTTLEFVSEIDWLSKKIELNIDIYKEDFKECFEHLHDVLNNKEQWNEKIKNAIIERIKAEGVWNENFSKKYSAEELYNMLKLYVIEVYCKKITFCFNDGEDGLYGGHDLGVEVKNNEINNVGVI